jgi:hypothetical protein
MRGELSGAFVGVVGGLVLLCAQVDVVHALPPLPPLWVQVTTVRADDSGKCDPRLKDLRLKLRSSVGYKSYQFVDKERRRVAWRSTEAFALPGERSLLLLPKTIDDQGRILMQVRLLEGRKRLIDTNVRLIDRGSMVFGLGKDARTGDGALLIVLKAEQQ